MRRFVTIRVSAYAALFCLLVAAGCDTVRVAQVIAELRVLSLSVSPKSLTVQVGQNVPLSATVVLEDNSTSDSAAWTSANTAVATVSPDGIVTARGVGVTRVKAARGEMSDSAAITVASASLEPVASVEITPPSASIEATRTLQLSAVLRDAAGNILSRPVAWTSSNPSAATVSSSGLVTGVAAGSSSILATSEGKSDTAAITVTAPPPPPPPPPAPVATVTVAPASATIETSRTVQLTATLRDASGNVLTGRPIAWTSSNSAVATVSGTGLVIGGTPGSANVVATSEGKSGTSAITVVAPPPPVGGAVPPVAIGMWISKAELDAIPTSGPAWNGTGELYAVGSAMAAATWVTNWAEIDMSDDAGGDRMREAMAGALVFARLKPANGSAHPDPTTDAMLNAIRDRIVTAITTLIATPFSLSQPDTRPARFIGGWCIIADLINLPAYAPYVNNEAPTFTGVNTPANTGFRGWIDYALSFRFNNDLDDQLRMQSGRLLTNRGSWARFSRAAGAIYLRGALSSSPELDKLVLIYKRWLGDTSIVTVAGEYQTSSPASLFQVHPESDTWQHVQPVTNRTRVGVGAQGATRNGNNFDGVQPGDQYRGFYSSGDPGGSDSDPSSYRATDFPNRMTGVNYLEVSAHAHVGMLHMLYRAGYTELLTFQNSAQLRAVKWIKYATDTFGAKGYVYFEGVHEAPRPMINYLWPAANLPSTRERTQVDGANYGYGWTFWTHAGRRVP